MNVISDCGAVALTRRHVLGTPLLAAALALSSRARAESSTPLQVAALPNGVALGGLYPGHLQGVCTNDRDTVYWSLTDKLVMTDPTGRVLKQVDVASHHGDLCHVDGKLYVAVNLGLFNDPQRRSDSWIHAYDAADLSFMSKHRADAVVYGAGGMTFGDGRFIVVGGLPADIAENYLYEFDPDLAFVRKITLKSGHTHLGIQTAAYHADHWWFGCYGAPEILMKVDRTFSRVQKFVYDCALGIVPLDRDTFLVAKGACSKDRGCVASLAPARLDSWIEQGLLKPV